MTTSKANRELKIRELQWLQLMLDAMFFDGTPVKRGFINSEKWFEDGFVKCLIQLPEGVSNIIKPDGSGIWEQYVQIDVPLQILHDLDGPWLIRKVFGSRAKEVIAQNPWLKSNMLRSGRE